jgi:hypothetical protein
LKRLADNASGPAAAVIWGASDMKCKRMVSGVLVLAGAWGGACLAGPREPAARGHDLQALTGPSFESLFRQAGQACPAARLRYASPADLLDAEDVYIAGLPAADKSRVAAAAPRSADGGYSACANRDGASCSVAAGLHAIEQAGLTRGFVASACRQFGKPD